MRQSSWVKIDYALNVKNGRLGEELFLLQIILHTAGSIYWRPVNVMKLVVRSHTFWPVYTEVRASVCTPSLDDSMVLMHVWAR